MNADMNQSSRDFLKSLGFPSLEVHNTFSHYDFTKPGRRVLLLGPMGSGKTEYSARVWRDAAIALSKGEAVRRLTSTGDVDRRKVFFIRSFIDGERFETYPEDALAYRSGYIRCGSNIARIRNSFDFEKVVQDNPTVGTYIIDEASFFDERLAYVVRNLSVERGIMFIFPTLVLNFRRDIFNSTARLMLDMATDVIPLTAYCEYSDCLNDAFYTYRYYSVDGYECPALYFDPLIIVGGDREKTGSETPNYGSRCDRHHFLPGKEYTYFILKPLAEQATGGDVKPLRKELEALNENIGASLLCENMKRSYADNPHGEIYMNALRPHLIAEKALMYLFNEQNLVSEDMMVRLTDELGLNRAFMAKTLEDNRRHVDFEQKLLF